MFSNRKRKYSAVPVVISMITAVVAVAACGIILRLTDLDPAPVCLCALGGYVAVQTVALLIYRFLSVSAALPSQEHSDSGLGELSFQLMNRLEMPVLVLDENERTVWYNKALTDRMETKGALFGRKFDTYAEVPLTDVTACADPDGLTVEASGRTWAVKAYPSRAQDRDYVVTVWQDESELIRARRLIEDENAVVAYVVLDNMDELVTYVQEKYRSASAEVEDILKKWASSADGVFKEYERDKFIFIFAAKYMEGFVESRFDVLDRVREVRVGDGSLPVTVSIGISQLGATLAEKEKNAHAALDTALQRGGDQAVVRVQGENKIYGGRIQIAQTRTKVRARVFADQLAGMVASASNVLIMAHVRPDFDAIGASIGLARLCFFCGVRVNVITDLDSPDFAKCRERIAEMKEYDGVFVDGSEGQDLLTGGSLLLITDVNNPAQFQAPYVADNAASVVVIDHHRKAGVEGFDPTFSYIEPAASSSCELVAEILEHCLPSEGLPREEADVMLAGIMLDTKQFTRNAGTRTFAAALYLRNEGGSTASAQELFRTDIDDIKREARFESNVIIYRKIIAIARGEGEGGEDRVSAAKAADKLLTVEGVAASFVVGVMGDSVHISARSAGTINVQLILESMGGGGHFESAATQLRGVTVKEALERLRAAIDAYLDETGVEE